MPYCTTIKKFFRPKMYYYADYWVGEYLHYGIWRTKMYNGTLSREAAEKAFNKRLIVTYKIDVM